MSDNSIKNIFESGAKKKGELKKESDAFNEFNRKDWEKENSLRPDKPVFFYPLESGKTAEPKSGYLPKLAADSYESDKEISGSYFYISEDDKYALKIDETRSGNISSIIATLITEGNKSADDCLLYCPQTKKYFIISSSNEIILTGYSSFEYKKFTFELIYPLNTFTFVKSQNNVKYVIISLKPEFSSTDYIMVRGSMDIKNSKFKNIRTAVIKSGNLKDFVNVSSEKISIPEVFIQPKFELLVY
jgi:hypothetical protein